MACVLVRLSLVSLKAVDAQADLSFRWSHQSYCRYCRALAHVLHVQRVLCAKVHQTSRIKRKVLI